MLLCNDPIKTKLYSSSWKIYVVIGYEFGMHSLTFQVETMILMFSIGALLWEVIYLLCE